MADIAQGPVFRRPTSAEKLWQFSQTCVSMAQTICATVTPHSATFSSVTTVCYSSIHAGCAAESSTTPPS